MKRKEICIWIAKYEGSKQNTKEEHRIEKGGVQVFLKKGKKGPFHLSSTLLWKTKKTSRHSLFSKPIFHQPCRLLRTYPTYDGFLFQSSSGSRLSRTPLRLLQSDGFRMCLGNFRSVSINLEEYFAKKVLGKTEIPISTVTHSRVLDKCSLYMVEGHSTFPLLISPGVCALVGTKEAVFGRLRPCKRATLLSWSTNRLNP